ncbi:hypothetical protein K469DRAFT_692042 [Zopfia rhizophila CBS 207.26]|uniref:Spherulation-specific family 4 n=1 Tax=Zopfia rhizophila CBS 207.26 TaxID=1314779 RepID=A0A6A6DT65_9PEZI|nr:hypothetical protein K469DRAFT_692042 [Zopfia rhizophila CBS 207.26]
MSILLPLYVYPWAGVWDPLYKVATSHPTLNFTVIVNPCSGPCVRRLPEQPYLDEIPKLKNYPNIRTLGYVATNYTNKGIDSVLEEIATYANWTALTGVKGMDVQGIFFDETPGTYDWEKYAYLKKATDKVKGEKGKGLVHNPGTIPGTLSNYLDLADITVIFEETFMNWLNKFNFDALKSFSSLIAQVSNPKSRLGIILHSTPTLADSAMQWVVQEMKGMVGWMFLTSVGIKSEYFHSFSAIFEGFIDAVGRAG